MFRALFRHIKNNQISMTAPVAMGYESHDQQPQLVSMAFVYQEPQMGEIGSEDVVQVHDMPPQTLLSIGVRGNYRDTRFEKNLDKLAAWLNSHQHAWQAAGDPRYLGYNSPFVPGFMRYGEVQIPIRKRKVLSEISLHRDDDS